MFAGPTTVIGLHQIQAKLREEDPVAVARETESERAKSLGVGGLWVVSELRSTIPPTKNRILVGRWITRCRAGGLPCSHLRHPSAVSG